MISLLREIMPYTNLLLLILLPFWVIRRFRLYGYLFAVLFIYGAEFLAARAEWALTGVHPFSLIWKIIGIPVALVWALALYGIVLLINRVKAPPAFTLRLNVWEYGGLALIVLYLGGLYCLIPLREKQIRLSSLQMHCQLVNNAQSLDYSAGTRPFLRRVRWEEARGYSAPSTHSAPLMISGEISNFSSTTTFHRVVAVMELTDERGKRVQLIAVRRLALSPLQRWHIEIPVTDRRAMQLAKKRRLKFGLLYVAAK